MPEKKVSPRTKSTKAKSVVSKPKKVVKFTNAKSIAKKIPIKRSTLSPIKNHQGTRLSALLADKQAPSKKVQKQIVIVDKPVKPKAKKVPAKPAPVADSVVLPGSMSLRAQAKVQAILSLANDDFYDSAQRIAYVSAFCFVLLGISMSVNVSNIFSSSDQQAAALSASMAEAELSATASPKFSLVDKIPSEVSDLTRFTFEVLHAETVEVIVQSQKDGAVTKLKTEDLSDGKFRSLIEAGKLPPAKYTVKVVAKGFKNLGAFSFPAGEFEVKPPVKPVVDATTSQAETSSEVTDLVQDAGLDDVVEQDSIDESSIANATEEIDVNAPLHILSLDNVLSESELIRVSAPEGARTVEMYLRPTQSITLRFIGLAEKSSDYWRFYFNSKNVPNGEYELFARTRSDDKFLESKPRTIKIDNIAKFYETAVSKPEETTTEIDTVSQVDVPSETQETEVEFQATTTLRSFSDLSISDSDATSSQSLDTFTKSEVDTLIESNRSEFAELLRRYAVAQQSGDPVLLELAKKELQVNREELVARVLTDNSVNYLADNINLELSARFESLQKRVDTFEELRRTASNQTTSLDSDGDGVSDFDEANLYGTDPEQPDTDNDGFVDGVEIMRGFDPRDASPEAAFVYESPKESLGLVQAEALTVQSVLPLVYTLPSGDQKIVQAHITGKALPNSFVTLYVYSTPTIVTVKTDADGSFEYTFEKELEDGEHEVYIAVTDNTGSIVAQSNPFRFIKQAEAFTPTNGSVSDMASTQTFDEFTSVKPFNPVAGMGILALGLVLLMLAIGMREQKKVTVQESPAWFRVSSKPCSADLE